MHRLLFGGHFVARVLHSFPTRRSSDLYSRSVASNWKRGAARTPSRWRTRLASTRADRKSTRLNSSHVSISYAVFRLKKQSHPNGGPFAATMPHPRHPGPTHNRLLRTPT